MYGIVYVTLQVKIKTEPGGYGAQKYPYVCLSTRFHLNVVILISFSLLKELQHRQMENVLVDSISDILLLCVSLHSITADVKEREIRWLFSFPYRWKGCSTITFNTAQTCQIN